MSDSDTYYEHSGSMSALGLPLMLIGGSVGTLLLSGIYGHAIYYIPSFCSICSCQSCSVEPSVSWSGTQPNLAKCETRAWSCCLAWDSDCFRSFSGGLFGFMQTIAV